MVLGTVEMTCSDLLTNFPDVGTDEDHVLTFLELENQHRLSACQVPTSISFAEYCISAAQTT